MKRHKQCLVLGANGQIGKALADELGDFALTKTRESLDISKRSDVEDILKYLRPDVVINCAGYSKPVMSESHQENAWKANTLAVTHLAKGCASRSIPFIHISCDHVFGSDESRRETHNEEDTVGPTAYYGATKLAAETSILRLASLIEGTQMKPWPYWIIRTSALFERPWRHSNNLVFRMMQLSRLRGSITPLPLPTDVVRRPTYAPHLAKALSWLSQNHEEVLPGIYHITNSGRPLSLFDIGFFLSTETNSRFRAESIDRDKYAGILGCASNVIPKYTAMETKKFEEIYPETIPTWEEALSEYVSEFARYEK